MTNPFQYNLRRLFWWIAAAAVLVWIASGIGSHVRRWSLAVATIRQVGGAGVARFRQTRPDCRIIWEQEQ